MLSLLVVCNVVAFLFYYRRTKRLLYRFSDLVNLKVDGTFKRVEARLIHRVPDFENTAGSPWAVMFTYDRKEMAVHTLETLKKYEPQLPVLVIDNGSKDGTPEVITQMLLDGRIQKVLLNTHEDVPQWQKAFALKQALKLLALEHPSHIVWLDDDLEVTRPFVKEGIELIEELKNKRVKVINMTDNEEEERNHPTIERIIVTVCGVAQEIKIRQTFNGQFNICSAEFFREFGYPPITEGISELAGEDWFYSRQLQNNDYRVAVFPAANHVGFTNSKRIEIEKRLAT